jgi:hypothetical protein
MKMFACLLVCRFGCSAKVLCPQPQTSKQANGQTVPKDFPTFQEKP